mmetsp:Transcript_1169/g.1281  ORF Transcript_1169/g.1281 Transcript_1169/m.1281 type:complete len:121 (-) Transcript_1169:374-736(-)
MVENSKINDNYFDHFVPKASISSSILKPASFDILSKLDEEAKPKSNVVMGWLNKTGNLLGISNESREELFEYAIVEKDTTELSNEDLILAPPGAVVKKTWKISNKQSFKWPAGVKVIYRK